MKTHLSNVYPTRLCHVLKVLGTPRTPQEPSENVPIIWRQLTGRSWWWYP
jgi:hypothetical protein